ncbi:MAG: hypothetical protein RLZZ612_1813 [Pseudomonadota bacterium]|jgi:hypothetical protein
MKRVFASLVCSAMTGAYAAVPAPVVCKANDLGCVLNAVSAGRALTITPIPTPEKPRSVSRVRPKNNETTTPVDPTDPDGDGVLEIDDVSTQDPNNVPQDASANPFVEDADAVDLDSDPNDDLKGDAAVAIDNKGPIDGVYECDVSLPFPPIIKTYVSINGKKDGMTVFLQAEISRSGNNFFGYGLGSVTRDSDNVFTYNGTTSAGQKVSFIAYKSNRTQRVTIEGGITLGVKTSTGTGEPIHANYECSKIF